MYFPSKNLPENADFLEIIRLLDHVQYKATSHCLTAEDVKTALHVYDQMKKYCVHCYVDVYGGFSVKGYQYKSHCSALSLTPNGGCVRRMVAPEERYGKGSKIVIILEGYTRDFPTIKDFYIVYKDAFQVRLKSLI